MISIFLNLCKNILLILKYPFYFAIGVFSLFFVLCSIFIVIGLLKGKRFKKGQSRRIIQHSFLRKLFIDLPKQFVDDLFDKDPDFFKYQGCVIFEGRQGKGKTISMIEFARRMQLEYPLSKCCSNIKYKYQDTKLTDWRMLMNYKNDIYGVIVIMDELQNWFSSNDSKNFPPEMLSIITQNRKNRRIILGTSQNFYLLAKAIRSQASEVRRCTTLLGCLTIVRRFEPILDSEGLVIDWKNRGMYFFVHNKELRDMYDTYEVVKRFSKVGFQDLPVNTDITNNVYNVISDKKIKR